MPTKAQLIKKGYSGPEDPWEAYKEWLEAGPQTPTPKVEAVPTPTIKWEEPHLTWGNIPHVTKPKIQYTPQMSSMGWQIQMPTYESIPPALPNLTASTGWQYARPYSAAPVYYSPAELRASTGWQYPPQLLQSMFGPNRTIVAGKEERTGGGLRINPGAIWNRYKQIYKKYYEGPMLDFMVSGEEEPAYSPGDYTYAGNGGGGITIKYGGGGTPSSSRNYASTLINWRV